VNADAARRQLRQRANELGLDFQQAIQYYAMERFLFRLSRSAWAERFIVKGAVMLRVWDAAVARPTRDIDFLGRIENTPEAVRGAVLEAFSGQAGTVAMWQAYRSRLAASGIQAPPDLADVLGTISAFVMPAARAAAEDAPFRQSWQPGEGWSLSA
jgi:predicted nucleotidyltransferase component of viral defense system